MTAGPSHRARSGLRAPSIALIAFAAACSGGGDAAPADSALYRDLALANQVAAQPQLQDVPLGAEPQPEQLEPRADPAPVRQQSRAAEPPPQPRRTPRVISDPAPRPRTPEPQVVEREAAPAPAPAPTPAAAPGPAPGFAAGTRLALTTSARICAVSGRPGDKLTATLRDPVRGTGGAMIPAGTTVVLEVVSVEPGDPAENGRIVFRVRSLDIDERAYAANGSGDAMGGLQRSEVPRVNASDRKKVITGAVIGAIAGRVLGGDTKGAVIGAAAGGAAGAISAKRDQRFEGCLPSGSPVTITLNEGLTVT